MVATVSRLRPLLTPTRGSSSHQHHLQLYVQYVSGGRNSRRYLPKKREVFFFMATESKQIDGVVDDPENGGLKSGPCLIAGFHALSCTSPSYYNPYRGVNKNTLSVDMVRLSLTFKGDRGEWLSRKGAQLTDCDEMSAWTSKIRPGGSVEPWPCRADEQQAAWAGSVMCYSITCNTRQGGATWPPRSHQ